MGRRWPGVAALYVMNEQAKPYGSVPRVFAYGTFAIVASLVGLGGLALTGAITGFVWGAVTRRPFPSLEDHPLWFVICASPAVLVSAWFIVRGSEWMKKRGWW